ncbi:MAG: hypothetical protein GVY34_04050 [Alphaproteobacteria bacterium]|nr:hypothetical protein [Alphaproteobacteria bacterium]
MQGRAQRWSIMRLVGMVAMCLAVLPAPGIAQTLQERRAKAIALWLANEETDGLRALAGLASDGDPQSQLLLGLIDKTSEMQGPELIAMSRPDRLALMRAPGGMSGRNWVHAAAKQGVPHALAWQTLWSVRADVTTAERFAALQEPQAVARTLLTLAKRRETGFAPAIVNRPWYPQTHLFLSDQSALLSELGAALHPADPQRKLLTGIAPDPDALRDWLSGSPVAAPLRATCEVVCAPSASDCTFALYRALGSYAILLTHGSPVNALIPNPEFIASPRGRAVLARRIMLMRTTRMRQAALDKLSEIDNCAADWLAMQFDRHTPQKIPTP